MESPPPKRNAGHGGEDGISALPDHLLLDILERLDLRQAVRAGALSTRWRHFPTHLSRVHLDVAHFHGATPLQVMDAFTGAARALLARVPPAEGVCDSGALKIELVSVPKLRQVECQCCLFENPPVRFGYVPELCGVILSSYAKASQKPFALSECLSRSARNLSILTLGFAYQMIWIQPEPPKQLIAIFRNLTSVLLLRIFSECDLSWTMFILEAAPALYDMTLSRHSCTKKPKDSAEKTNVVWEPYKDLKHLNLKVLRIFGCEDEGKVTNYIRLVMERAVGLLKILLYGESPCRYCDADNLERSKAEKASRHQIKEQLTHGSSSSVKIIIC